AEKRDAVPLGITRLRGARSEGGKREAGREQRQTCLDEPHVSSRVFPAKDRPSLWLFFAASASRERGGARQPQKRRPDISGRLVGSLAGCGVRRAYSAFGSGRLEPSVFRKAIRSARSLGFLTPAKVMAVPGMYLPG